MLETFRSFYSVKKKKFGTKRRNKINLNKFIELLDNEIKF